MTMFNKLKTIIMPKQMRVVVTFNNIYTENYLVF